MPGPDRPGAGGADRGGDLGADALRPAPAAGAARRVHDRHRPPPLRLARPRPAADPVPPRHRAGRRALGGGSARDFDRRAAARRADARDEASSASRSSRLVADRLWVLALAVRRGALEARPQPLDGTSAVSSPSVARRGRLVLRESVVVVGSVVGRAGAQCAPRPRRRARRAERERRRAAVRRRSRTAEAAVASRERLRAAMLAGRGR